MVIKIFIFIFFVHLTRCQSVRQPMPEANMSVDEIIRYHGYPVEVHEVFTSDGYILSMQRIPRGINESKSDDEKHPVLLQHGLAASASNWVTNMPSHSLGFILADHGYDVWLGNVRGNTYSKRHLTLKSTDRKFWEFSWQDMAENDLPAMIKYILTNTTSKQLSYVGHSQGSLIGFAKFSSDWTLARKIKTFIALAPISTVGDITSPLKMLAPFSSEIRAALSVLGDYSLGGLSWITKYVKPACDQPYGIMLCENLFFYLVGGENKTHLNQSRIPVFMAHNPDDTSMKNLVHFAQMIQSKKMRQFDYGYIGNWKRYGRLTPPEYDMTKMNVSTVAFWSPDDELSDTKDVALLLTKLQRVLAYRIDEFSHVDFLWSMQARSLIYEKILDTLKRGENRLMK